MSKNWFNVDKKGLAQLLERRGFEWIVYELYQNAADEKTAKIDIQLEYDGTRKTATLKVSDDNPEGFRNLKEAYTLFAPSNKKANPEQRGRFNLGEKLVLAVCREAEIRTISGGIRFDETGRSSLRKGTATGSVFEGLLTLTRDQFEECLTAMDRVLVPAAIEVTINGRRLQHRNPIKTIENVTLPTEVASADGVLRRTRRMTTLHVHEPLPGTDAMLYEMGIPVAPTGDRWSVDVQQKVPLDLERSNVTPSYLAAVRAALLNQMAEVLNKEEATAPWVRATLEDNRVQPAAVVAVVNRLFGEKRVSYDPSDPEANQRATAAGYAVIHGGALSGAAWTNLKRAGAIEPAGKVMPTPRPTSADGQALREVAEDKWSPGMKACAALTQKIGQRLLGVQVTVKIVADVTWWPAATYGMCTLTFNTGKLGRAFFDKGASSEFLDLVIHELAHHWESNHLSENYYRALSKLGGQLTRLALDEPEFFSCATVQPLPAKIVASSLAREASL